MVTDASTDAVTPGPAVPAPEPAAPAGEPALSTPDVAVRRSLARRLLRAFTSWLPLAVALTIVSMFMFAAGQHQFRSSANDPAIQLAEDGVAALAAGDEPVFPSTQVIDLKLSVAPFMIVYDEQGKVARGSAVLNGDTPTPPSGVFSSTPKGGENRFTWEPESGVRLAVALAHNSGTGGGYVLGGRSLREVESRINDLFGIVVMGWVVGLGASLATALLVGAFRR